MHKCLLSSILSVLFIFAASSVRGQGPPSRPLTFPLNSLQGLEVVNGTAEMTTYRGCRAVHLVPLPDHRSPGDAVLAILTGPDFKDGTIEVEVAGSRRADSGPDERGFIGLAFRVQPHASSYENVYLRPVNGRADDQLQRNHSVQYLSPGFSMAPSPCRIPRTIRILRGSRAWRVDQNEDRGFGNQGEPLRE